MADSDNTSGFYDEGKLSAPMQTAQRLLRMACHDLSEPLNTIHLCAQAALFALKQGEVLSVESLTEILGRMECLALAGSTFLSGVLSVERVNRATSGRPSNTDVEEALASAVSIQSEALVRAGCQVIVTRPEGTARITGPWDRPSLVSIFSNLLQNSCRYAPGTPIRIDISEAGRDLCICVTDGGPGLPTDPDPDETPVSGFTSGPRHGLGLWIVNEAVAALAGRIAVGIPSDRGLSVQILLPMPRQEASLFSLTP